MFWRSLALISGLEQAAEKKKTIADTRFVLDAGMSGDLLDLYIALAPCMIGYGEIGVRLASAVKLGAGKGHPYSEWINEYASDGYQELTQATMAHLDHLAAASMTEARYPALRELFRTATLLEADFWQMGLGA